MPDFIAALLAAAAFCAGVIALNALTHLAIQMHVAPSDLAEGGFVQYGAGLLLAGTTWRRTLHRRA